MRKLRSWTLVCIAIAAGCSSIGPAPVVNDRPTDSPTTADIVVPQLQRSEALDLWGVLREGFALDHAADEPAVVRAVEQYTTESITAPALDASVRRYLAYVVDEVRRRDLPTELALLPLIESTMNPYASSDSGASGLWQLIPGTAKQYGVTIDWWYDGRRDLVDSTAAALDYLTHLYAEFGDWLIALAAYNGGEGRIRKALADEPGAGFFDLDLPPETRRYVPKLLALARHIELDANALPTIDAQPPFFAATLNDQIDLGVLARIGGLPLDEVFRLNAGLNRLTTPPYASYRLLIPSTHRDAFAAALDRYPGERVAWTQHRVQHGESLASIAKRYRTSVAAIRTSNRLGSNVIHPNQALLVAIGSTDANRPALNPFLK